jgi:peroxiredoxin
MNRILTVLLVTSLLVITAGCRNGSRFVVEGTLKQGGNVEIKLKYLTADHSITIDSAFVDRNDYFKLSGTSTVSGFYALTLPKSHVVYLVIHPGDRITVEIDDLSGIPEYYIEGSYDSKLVKELILQQNRVLGQIAQLSDRYEKIKHTADEFLFKKRKLDSVYQVILNDQRKWTRKFIHEHPQSLASLMALYQNYGKTPEPLFDRLKHYRLYNVVDSNLIALYPNASPVKELNREVTEIKQMLEAGKKPGNLKEGMPAPSFEIPDIDGDTIVLEDFRNQYVVINFWASWNALSVSRAMFKEIPKEILKNEKLKLLQVSLDKDRRHWEQAIASNNLPGIHVSDLQYWNSNIITHYQIRKVPSIVIINKSGIVIGRDLYGDELKKLLTRTVQ